MQTPYWVSECGSVTIYCADCIEVLPFLKCDELVTDPPYGIGLEYNTHDDNLKDWFTLMDKVVPLAKACARFAVMPAGRIDQLQWWYKNHNPNWIIAWYKGSPGQRSMIGFNCWEPHMCFGRPKIAMPDYFQTRCGFEETHTDHPCPKPIEWAEWLITRGSQPGDVILDPFMGSGTVAIAAIRHARRFIGIEKDKHYCDQAIGRIRLEKIINIKQVPPPVKKLKGH